MWQTDSAFCMAFAVRYRTYTRNRITTLSGWDRGAPQPGSAVYVGVTLRLGSEPTTLRWQRRCGDAYMAGALATEACNWGPASRTDEWKATNCASLARCLSMGLDRGLSKSAVLLQMLSKQNSTPSFGTKSEKRGYTLITSSRPLPQRALRPRLPRSLHRPRPGRRKPMLQSRQSTKLPLPQWLPVKALDFRWPCSRMVRPFW